MLRLINLPVRVALLLLLALAILQPVKVSAVSASDWKAGNIIDDAIFYNNTDMSAADIQNFLNSKMPSCDTNGTKIYSGSQTRAQYGASRGYPAPYTCLRNYSQNGLSAAQIIKQAADTHRISAKSLIVLLQKEQALVTDDWPWPNQYRSATGYGCPDTAPCDAEYYGFYNQVMKAAFQFRRYATYPNEYRYKPYRENYVQYNPTAACGGTNVNIANLATAGLYNYTPYQPNASALGNLYGTGDSCGAYGNRNFWRLFNDWFGPTHFTNIPGCNEATNTSLVCVWKVRNNSNNTEIISTAHSKVNQLVNGNGYTYVGKAFIARSPSVRGAGNIPVYGLTKGDGSTFLTASLAEYNALSGSWTPNGVTFYADPANRNTGYPVYRLHSSSSGHVWTSNLNEVNTYIGLGFSNEGVAFTALSPVKQEVAPGENTDLVYRFGSMPGGLHFWTRDVEERDNMIRAGYNYEGVAWNVIRSATALPVYRLYSPAMRKHLYTKDQNERNVLAATAYWNYEGVSWYSTTDTAKPPVYRLYLSHNTEHLYTADAYERNELVRTGVGRYEGVAWYQP